MTSKQQEECKAYIKRSIPDIARKCGITDDEVVNIMYKVVSDISAA